MQQAVIFDLDDTLVDFAGYKAQGGRYFDGVMQNEMQATPLLSQAEEYAARGIQIVIITARPTFMREATEAWINDNLPTAELHMTQSTKRQKDVVIKSAIMDTIADKYEFIAAYDDQAPNREMFQSFGIPTPAVQ